VQDSKDTQLEHLGILLLGDSIDYRIARSYCNISLGVGLSPFGDDPIAREHNLTGDCPPPHADISMSH
jgi:hypothetical protein